MTLCKNLLVILLILSALISCRQEDNEYAFFVAGHTYGSPSGKNPGLHPPFIRDFGRLNNDSSIAFGVLTGDIVRKSDTLSWDSVDAQLSKLRMPVYFSPGNHDTYNRELYEDRYGKTYFTFEYMNDRFIILDGNISNWNIDGEQLAFLKESLKNAGHGTRNIFVFIHQLIWWDEMNIFGGVHLNWPPYTPDTTNYWGEVEPLLQRAVAPVFFFAGDIGANDQATPVMYYHEGNITYIASGMGNIHDDNYIIVRIHAHGDVTFELIAPGDDHGRLGKLEDHDLNRSD